MSISDAFVLLIYLFETKLDNDNIYLLELTFLGQWWSKSDCVLYINHDDLHKIINEHILVM